MIRRPRLLDLYCGAGGASAGYDLAGFDVMGVDVRPQPRYPYPLLVADVLELTPRFLRYFDLIHASPPCQHATAMRTMHNARPHVDLIHATRALLLSAEVDFVIENVEGAALITPVTLCGTMFGLGYDTAELRRHRQFETTFPVNTPWNMACQHGSGGVIGVYGGHVRNRRRRKSGVSTGRRDFPAGAGQEAMGIQWMTLAELSQAIPPAYTQWVGAHALQHLDTLHTLAAGGLSALMVA